MTGNIKHIFFSMGLLSICEVCLFKKALFIFLFIYRSEWLTLCPRHCIFFDCVRAQATGIFLKAGCIREPCRVTAGFYAVIDSPPLGAPLQILWDHSFPGTYTLWFLLWLELWVPLLLLCFLQARFTGKTPLPRSLVLCSFNSKCISIFKSPLRTQDPILIQRHENSKYLKELYFETLEWNQEVIYFGIAKWHQHYS